MGNPSAGKEAVTRSIGGHEVTISNPAKVLFPKPKYTKLDLANYYLAVAEGALRGAGGRPNMLVRFPNGIGAPSFYQKRAPESRPSWIEVVTLRFPSGRTADELVPRTPASLAWMANLACLELHPHPVRAEDLDHPDELRVDLDPVPGIKWPQVRQVAQLARVVLADLDRKSTRLNSSHLVISYAVFCLKKKKNTSTGCTKTIREHQLRHVDTNP